MGQDWTEATKNDLWAGGALIAISALTLILFAAFALRDAARAVEQAPPRLRRTRTASSQSFSLRRL